MELKEGGSEETPVPRRKRIPGQINDLNPRKTKEQEEEEER